MSLDLSRPVALFPMPNMVFFPRTVLPLHIFEPRYRQMMEEVLEERPRILAVALLQEGWQEDYFGTPPVHPVVTVGRVTRCSRLPDGRFNLKLQGLARARILEEVPSPPYRRARLAALRERRLAPAEDRGLMDSLTQALQRIVQSRSGSEAVLSFDERLGAGGLCDRLAAMLPLELEQKQALLCELDPAARCESLLGYLSAVEERLAVVKMPSHRPFPGFSMN